MIVGSEKLVELGAAFRSVKFDSNRRASRCTVTIAGGDKQSVLTDQTASDWFRQ